jgi:hypothetical protein
MKIVGFYQVNVHDRKINEQMNLVTEVLYQYYVG